MYEPIWDLIINHMPVSLLLYFLRLLPGFWYILQYKSYQWELPARSPPSKEAPQNPPDKCPAKIKCDIGVIVGDHLTTKDDLPILGRFL